MADAQQLESVEADAWGDLFSECGLSVSDVGGVTVLRAPAFENPDMNRAIGLGVVAPATEEQLDAVIAEFGTAVPYFLQVVPDTNPPELHDWITARGFEKRRRWVKLWRSLHEPPGFELRDMAPFIDAVRPKDATTWARTLAAGFGFPEDLTKWFAPLVRRDEWRCYLAYVKGEVAGAGLMHMANRAAELTMGCALKPFRGKGVQGALIERRLSDAYKEGARIAVCEAAEDVPGKPNPSLHNLLRLDFQEAYKRENYQKP